MTFALLILDKIILYSLWLCLTRYVNHNFCPEELAIQINMTDKTWKEKYNQQ